MSFFKSYPQLENNWSEISRLLHKKTYPEKTTLLFEGDISDKIFIIEKGALREWNNFDGKDITFQFFFEGQGVSSFESFHLNKQSNFSIKTIEKSELYILEKSDLEKLLLNFPFMDSFISEAICERFIDYTNYFLSHLKELPEERYISFKEKNPQIEERVPSYYVASYLGITPVSLSRIKQRQKNKWY